MPPSTADHHSGILGRLRRDVRGNTIALMAAMLIPLLAFSGSAVDMARMYLVKSRLQQACDAGVLAGRQLMKDTVAGTPLETDARTQAIAFFNNNFGSNWLQTTGTTFNPIKKVDGGNAAVANAVAGTASTNVPMTIMQLFGQATMRVDVACEAHYDLADTDVMFVLDTTASMSAVPSAAGSSYGTATSYTRNDNTTGTYAAEASGSKIEALRQAVLLFDTTMRSYAQPSSHSRYGFVPYSSAVNVGSIIPSKYLQKNVNYDTRVQLPASSDSQVSTAAAYPLTQAECTTAKRSPASGYAKKFTIRKTGNTFFEQPSNYYAYVSFTGTPTWTNANGGTCTGAGTTYVPTWRYQRSAVDTTAFINSLLTNGPAVANPSRLDGSTNKWRGCIEEVDTRSDATFSDLDNLPDDLDPDTAPSSAGNMWRPLWPELTWLRAATTQDVKDSDFSEDSNSQYYNLSYRTAGYLERNTVMTACGMPAQTLKEMTAAEVRSYVYNNDFKAWGTTYHDVGMVWGLRMISPDGIFGSTTAAWSGHNEPSRNIIFMTDGQMETFPTVYGQYGIEQLDDRITGSGAASTESARHSQRFRALCDMAKFRKGITIYVIAFGTALNSDLSYCASPGQAFYASKTDELTGAFETIAKRVANLRITR